MLFRSTEVHRLEESIAREMGQAKRENLLSLIKQFQSALLTLQAADDRQVITDDKN